MNDEFMTLLFKNKDVKEIVIKKENNLYQISAGGHTAKHEDFLQSIDILYKLIRYDPIPLSIASYINFFASNRCINRNTFEIYDELHSTILPPSYEELLKCNMEFVNLPNFYANGKQYECGGYQYKNSDTIDYSVYKWLYTITYDNEGNCRIRGVLKNDI